VSLPHLILRDRFAAGGARTSIGPPARMRFVGSGGVAQIALGGQGESREDRYCNWCFLTALVALGTPRHGWMIALITQ
jgi:hypothetical protein